jgi:hypothetical protein
MNLKEISDKEKHDAAGGRGTIGCSSVVYIPGTNEGQGSRR